MAGSYLILIQNESMSKLENVFMGVLFECVINCVFASINFIVNIIKIQKLTLLNLSLVLFIVKLQNFLTSLCINHKKQIKQNLFVIC